jgi:hypothetical protein
MTEPNPPDLDLEALVRGHLDREAEAIDPRPLFARILGSDAAPRAVPSRPRRIVRFVLGGVGAAAAAAVVLAGAALLWRDRTALAKGESVVREARKAHHQPIDRSYLVEVRRESSRVAELSPIALPVRQTRLWTRGDRFFVESVRPDQRWAWGRDEVNRFWIAFGPRTAVQLDADEVPAALGIYCDLNALNVERWLGEVLDRFDLTREPATDQGDASTIVVHARARGPVPKGPTRTVRSADFEIDAETRVVRRVVVHWFSDGEPFATVTYSLVETDALDPALYRLDGHLDDRAEVFTRDHHPERRREMLLLWFGPRSARGFPAPAAAAPSAPR